MNQSMSSPTPSSASIDIERDGARILCTGNVRQVTISGSDKENSFTLGHDGMLKLAIQLLTSPDVRKLFPHAALPEGTRPEGGQAQTADLTAYRDEYQEKFGESDHLGKSNVVGDLKRGGSAIVWGGNGATLDFKNSKSEEGRSGFRLTTEGPVSLHLIVDVMSSFVRDIQSKRFFPALSATYLRRWGEEAFEGGQLKAEIPQILKAGILLKPSEGEPEITLSRSNLTPPPPASVVAAEVPVVPAVERAPQTFAAVAAPVTREPVPVANKTVPDVTETAPLQLKWAAAVPSSEKKVTPPALVPPVGATPVVMALTPEQEQILSEKFSKINQAREKLAREKVELAQVRATIRTEKGEVAEEHRIIKNRETILRGMQETIDNTVSDIATRENHIEQQLKLLEKKEKELQRHSSSITHAEDILRERRLAIEARERALEGKPATSTVELMNPVDEGTENTAEQAIRDETELDKIADARFAGLIEMEEELLQKGRQLGTLAESLTAREDAIAVKSRELSTREVSVAEETEELNQRERALNQQQESPQTLGTALARTQQELSEKGRTLEDRAREIESLSASVQKQTVDENLRDSQIAERLRALEIREETLRQGERELLTAQENWKIEFTRETESLIAREEAVSANTSIITEVERRIGRTLAQQLQNS